jgi:hypothetical protein
MNMRLIYLMLMATISFAKATVPDAATLGQGEMVEKFDWAQVDHQDVPGGLNVAWNWWPSTGEAAVFAGNAGKEPVDLNLRTLGPSICSKLTAARYAIVSRLGYEDISPPPLFSPLPPSVRNHLLTSAETRRRRDRDRLPSRPVPGGSYSRRRRYAAQGQHRARAWSGDYTNPCAR